MSSLPSNQSYGGYTCASCGSYVPNGVTHSCSPAAAIQTPGDWALNAALTRIAMVLERIADALEKQAAVAPSEGDAG